MFNALNSTGFEHMADLPAKIIRQQSFAGLYTDNWPFQPFPCRAPTYLQIVLSVQHLQHFGRPAVQQRHIGQLRDRSPNHLAERIGLKVIGNNPSYFVFPDPVPTIPQQPKNTLSQHPVIMSMQLGHAFLQVTKMPSGGVFRGRDGSDSGGRKPRASTCSPEPLSKPNNDSTFASRPYRDAERQAVMLDKERVREQVV